ncbi:hypothetical protein pb186bvf_011829 [Paramecium bursaria]
MISGFQHFFFINIDICINIRYLILNIKNININKYSKYQQKQISTLSRQNYICLRFFNICALLAYGKNCIRDQNVYKITKSFNSNDDIHYFYCFP